MYRRDPFFRLLLCGFAFLAAFALAIGTAAAQDVAVTNARIIVGNGSVIDSGTIVVRRGRIASVSAGPVETQGMLRMDAAGMTAMPGFIDAHKHINTGPNEREQMQALLEAGYTTILSGGGPAEGNLMLRDHIESGQINGPRIIPSGRIPAQQPGGPRIGIGQITPEAARARVRELAAMGIEWTGEIALTPEPGPSEQEIEVLRAVVDEAKKSGVNVQVHAVSTPAMMAAVDAGVRRLVHLPNKDWVSRADAKKLEETNTLILGTVGFGAPIIGVFADDNSPRFRNGQPWPDSIAGANRDPQGLAIGTEAGYAMVNARTVWDQDAVLGYCTDSSYEPRAGLEHELKSYNVMFSMRDIVKLMGPNTAAYINMGDQLGTLEPGKLADIVLLGGDPMEGYWNMLKVKLVLKGGRVVVDKR
ncbi:MAG TPA: amidohydrolase family protein [Gammaproteobacteria bacterium]|nr:amidohydrolase family protein [Gammaproteobacteria bacterium]